MPEVLLIARLVIICTPLDIRAVIQQELYLPEPVLILGCLLPAAQLMQHRAFAGRNTFPGLFESAWGAVRGGSLVDHLLRSFVILVHKAAEKVPVLLILMP